MTSTPKVRNRDIRSPYPKSPISTLTRRFSNEELGKGFSPAVAVCFGLNYVVGTGFLVLPWVFVQAGLVLSVVTVVASSFVADAAKDYVIVAMARADYVIDHGLTTAPTLDSDSESSAEGSKKISPKSETTKLLANKKNLIAPENNKELHRHHSEGYTEPGRDVEVGRKKKQQQSNNKLIVRDRTVELSSLSDIFLGKIGLFVYTFLLSIYMYMMLWAYTSVFAQAMAVCARIPGIADDYQYTVYAIMFAIIVVPMSFVEVEDQVVVQITLTVFRVARLLLMIGTSLYCQHCFGETSSESIPMWRLEGFHILLPIVIAANLMHEAIPDLSAPVRDKSILGKTFMWTFICTAVIYSILGAAVSNCFGHSVEPSSNINWISFHSPDGAYEWLYSAIGYFVVVSPTLDVISAYPLNAIALGNNLMEVRCGGSVHDIEVSYFTRMVFRMWAAIPPIIGALFVKDLGVITDYAGVAGLAVTFCITAAMFVQSTKFVESRKGMPTETVYDTYSTNKLCALTIFWFGLALVVYVLYELITEGSGD